eukprot:c12932_g1_i1 orf=52-780(+)
MALLHACTSISSTHKPHSLSSPFAKHRPAHGAASKFAASLSTHALKREPLQLKRFGSSFFNDGSLLKVKREIEEIKGGTMKGGACTATNSIALSGEALRWTFAAAAAVLMFLKNTAINKAILVPLLALQAPREAVTWIRGEYGVWMAFLALLVRLFYHIPGELELPLVFVLLVITSPLQTMHFRGTPAGLIVSAVVAAYLVYQHFTGAGGVKESFKEGTSILASLAVILLVVVPIAFFIGGY